MDINRELDIILEDGRFDRIRNLFKRKESTKPRFEPKVEKGFFGASDRRSFLKKTGKTAAGSMLPFQHLGLNPVTIKAVTDTLSGQMSDKPIFADIEKQYRERRSDIPLIDNSLLELQDMWHKITRITENPIDMICGYGFRSKISPNSVASIIQQITKNNSHKVKIGDEYFTISDKLGLNQNNVVKNITNEISAIKSSWFEVFKTSRSEEEKRDDKERYDQILKRYENRLAKAIKLSKTAKYDFYLISDSGTKIHITDLPEELSNAYGSDLTQCGRDFSKAVLTWLNRDNTPLTISKKAIEYLKKIGAKPKQFNTWEEYAEAAYKDEEDMLARHKERERLNKPSNDESDEEPEEIRHSPDSMERLNKPSNDESDEEPEEIRHSPDSMETMRGTHLQYPYDENFNRKLSRALFS